MPGLRGPRPEKQFGGSHRAALYGQLLRAVAAHRVADRPDRFEPRMAKPGPRWFDGLTRPRAVVNRQMLKRTRKK